MKSRQESETAPFELIEESFHLVRTAPVSAWAAYYVGALPFVLALLYFWSDMSRSAFAEQRLIPGTLALTALFVWMKAWQSIYCRHLLARLCGETAPAWTVRAFLQSAAFQAIVQPAGLFLLPLAALLMFPLGWAYAFFSAATVVHGTTNRTLRAALVRAWRQTIVWPLQNHYLLSLISLFALFVFINILSAVLGVPYLFKVLLGIESVFTRSPWAAMNSTLLAAQLGLTYLCLDPVLKAAYVLRCFQSESLRTGQDLRTELASLRPGALAALTAAVLLLLPATLLPPRTAAVGPAPVLGRSNDAVSIAFVDQHSHGAESGRRHPQGPMRRFLPELSRVSGGFVILAAAAPANSAPVTPEQLEHSIEQTIQRREFSWRLPPDSTDAAKADTSFLARLGRQFEKGMKAVGRWLEDAMKWLFEKLFPRNRPGAGGPGFGSAMEIAFVLLIALLFGVILWLLVRLWQRRPQVGPILAEALPAPPDLANEEVSADELPEDGWIRLGRDLLAQGDLRLALRAFYLASLAHLGDRRLITLARSKSNRDYERELQRRAHALGALPELFARNLDLFERAWYGQHAVTADQVDRFTANLAQMKGAPSA